MIFKSIKWRLQLWYGLSLLAVLVGFGLAAFQLERSRVLRRIDGELSRRLNPLNGWLRNPGRGPGPDEMRPGGYPGPGSPPRPEGDRDGAGPMRRPVQPPLNLRLPPELASLFEESDTNGFYYVIVLRDGRELLRSKNAPVSQGEYVNGPLLQRNAPPATPEGSTLPLRYDGPPHSDDEPDPRRRPAVGEPPVPEQRGSFRQIDLFTPPGERIVVGRNIASDLAELRLVALRLAMVGGGVLLLGLAGGWWLATRALRPIKEISRTAQDIAAGDLSQRINASETESELGQLAAVLNSTFSRLDAAFARQQQFTSDAAHELRTPVSVILAQTQSTLNKDRSAAEYRETLEACQRAANRMKKLVESLLELARLDAGQSTGKRETINLTECIEDCVSLVRPLAEARKIQFRLELEPTSCLGDADQLALVFTNLLTNAVHYNRDGGEVRVSARQENGFAVVTVTDNGIGIAADHLPRIFDRFYRADTARTSSQGRTGLGLAITKAIVESHGGTINVASTPDVGTSFVVRLPAV